MEDRSGRVRSWQQPRSSVAWSSGGAGDYDGKNTRLGGGESGGRGQEADFTMWKKKAAEGDKDTHATSRAMYASVKEKERRLEGTHRAFCRVEKSGGFVSVLQYGMMLAEIEKLDRDLQLSRLKADQQLAKELPGWIPMDW